MLENGKNILLLLAALAWWWKCRNGPVWSRLLGAQLTLAAVVEGIGMLFAAQGMSNHWLYNTYMLLEFALLTGMMARMNKDWKWSRVVVAGTTILFLLVFLANIRAHRTYDLLATSALVIGGLLMAATALFTLFHQAATSPGGFARTRMFWVLMSVLSYTLCSTPVMGLYNYLSERGDSLADSVYVINDTLFVLRYGLMTWAVAGPLRW